MDPSRFMPRTNRKKKRMNRRGMDHQSKRFQAPLTFFLWVRGIMTFDVFYEGLCRHTVCYLLPLDNDDDDDHDDCGLLGCYFRFQFVRGLQTSNEWTQHFFCIFMIQIPALVVPVATNSIFFSLHKYFSRFSVFLRLVIL